MLKSPSKNFLSKLNYEDIESFFDYESTLTYYQESQDPWDVFYGKQNSSPSEETQPTESSSKETSKKDDEPEEIVKWDMAGPGKYA